MERESLLDVVMAKAQSMGVTEKIQRVLIAFPYTKASDSGADVGSEIASTISRIEAEDEQATEERPSLISGISLLMPGVCLSLLEGPQRLIIGTLRTFQQKGSRMREVTSSMHMFLSVQDTPGRSFPSYVSTVVKVKAAIYKRVHIQAAACSLVRDGFASQCISKVTCVASRT